MITNDDVTHKSTLFAHGPMHKEYLVIPDKVPMWFVEPIIESTPVPIEGVEPCTASVPTILYVRSDCGQYMVLACDDCGKPIDTPMDNGDGLTRCISCSTKKYKQSPHSSVLLRKEPVINHNTGA